MGGEVWHGLIRYKSKICRVNRKWINCPKVKSWHCEACLQPLAFVIWDPLERRPWLYLTWHNNYRNNQHHPTIESAVIIPTYKPPPNKLPHTGISPLCLLLNGKLDHIKRCYKTCSRDASATTTMKQETSTKVEAHSKLPFRSTLDVDP